MSHLVENLKSQLGMLTELDPVQELVFAPPRRWRFDLAFPEKKIAVEVEGGIYIQGRHSRGAAFEKDCEKYNRAAMMGWTVLRFGPKAVRSGDAANTILEALRK